MHLHRHTMSFYKVPWFCHTHVYTKTNLLCPHVRALFLFYLSTPVCPLTHTSFAINASHASPVPSVWLFVGGYAIGIFYCDKKRVDMKGMYVCNLLQVLCRRIALKGDGVCEFGREHQFQLRRFFLDRLCIWLSCFAKNEKRKRTRYDRGWQKKKTTP